MSPDKCKSLRVKWVTFRLPVAHIVVLGHWGWAGAPYPGLVLWRLVSQHGLLRRVTVLPFVSLCEDFWFDSLLEQLFMR